MNTLLQPSRPGAATVSRMLDFAQPTLLLKNILVPIDFSKSSQKAFEYALPLARQFGGEVTLLHVIEPPPYSLDLSYIPMSEGFPTASVKKELEDLGNRIIESELLKDVIVQVGTAFEVITSTARDCEVDLIVLTTHGKTGLTTAGIVRVLREVRDTMPDVSASEPTISKVFISYAHRDAATADGRDCAHAGTPSSMVRTSTTSPAIAAAATIAGLMSSVRPVGLP